jgi:hypothetical protein
VGFLLSLPPPPPPYSGNGQYLMRRCGVLFLVRVPAGEPHPPSPSLPAVTAAPGRLHSAPVQCTIPHHGTGPDGGESGGGPRLPVRGKAASKDTRRPGAATGQSRMCDRATMLCNLQSSSMSPLACIGGIGGDALGPLVICVQIRARSRFPANRFNRRYY